MVLLILYSQNICDMHYQNDIFDYLLRNVNRIQIPFGFNHFHHHQNVSLLSRCQYFIKNVFVNLLRQHRGPRFSTGLPM